MGELGVTNVTKGESGGRRTIGIDCRHRLLKLHLQCHLLAGAEDGYFKGVAVLLAGPLTWLAGWVGERGSVRAWGDSSGDSLFGQGQFRPIQLAMVASFAFLHAVLDGVSAKGLNSFRCLQPRSAGERRRFPVRTAAS
jgi:hypothetical protein